MSTLYISHSSALDHLTPPGHPERPDRICVIERTLEQARFLRLIREQAPSAELSSICRVHAESYVQALHRASPVEGLVEIDAETVLSPFTMEAAMRSAGAGILAVDEVMTGKVKNAFSAMRPPGHHAEHDCTMGFCFFNNAAIAARHTQFQHGANRVAILDWDVHHGNGIQHIFGATPRLCIAPPMRWRCFRGRATRRSMENSTISSMCRCKPATAARFSGPH